MEKRLLLAVILMGAVLMITSILMPPPPPPEAPDEPDPAMVTEPLPAAPPPVLAPAPIAPAVAADTIVVRSPLYRYAISTRGGALVGAELLRYESYVHPGAVVQLVPPGAADLLAQRVVVAGDTLDLRLAPFTADAPALELSEATGPQELRLSYVGEQGLGLELVYTFRPDDYLIGVRGRVLGLNGTPARLLTDLGPAIWPHEAPEHRSEQEMSIVMRTDRGDLERQRMRRLPPVLLQPGPLTWVGMRDKYFLAAVITGEHAPITNVAITRLADVQLPRPAAPRDSIVLPRADVTAALPVAADGTFAYDAYVGPQEYERLAAIGFDLEEVTPYAYAWLQPIIRPFAAAILWVLRYLHNTLGIGYGWVLVIFGVLMRIVLWPLNAKAMRAQVKNMAVQPLMMEIREKYKNDPQKQQEEMVRLYKEHGFNPLAGCLPMLVPFPILITLFFVFQNSIVFRGESFLWLPDLSLKDPLYILPVFLMASMFGLQWISAKTSGMEQNPQMKMMMYFMPIMLGIIFFQLASGLNLYYAVTNIATIPQQLLISKERKKAQEALKAQGVGAKPAPSTTAPTRPGGKRAKKRG